MSDNSEAFRTEIEEMIRTNRAKRAQQEKSRAEGLAPQYSQYQQDLQLRQQPLTTARETSLSHCRPPHVTYLQSSARTIPSILPPHSRTTHQVLGSGLPSTDRRPPLYSGSHQIPYQSPRSAQQPTRPQRRSDLNFPSISTRPQQRSALNLPSIPPAFARYQSEIYGNRNIGQASGSSLRSTDHISTGSSRQPLMTPRIVSIGQRTVAQPFQRSPNYTPYVSLLDRYAPNVPTGEPNWDQMRRDIAIEHRERMSDSFQRRVPLGQRLAEKSKEELRAMKDSKGSPTDRLTSILDRQNRLKRGTDNRWLQTTRTRYDPHLRPQLELSDNESRRIAMGYRDKSKSLSDLSSEPSVRLKPLLRRHSVSAVLDKRDKEIRETFENENQWTRELRRRHPYQVNRERMNEQDIYRINRMNAVIKRDLDHNYMRADRRKSVGKRAVLPNIQLQPAQTNVFPVPEEDEEEDSDEY